MREGLSWLDHPSRLEYRSCLLSAGLLCDASLEHDSLNEIYEAFQHHDEVRAIHSEGGSTHHGESYMISYLASINLAGIPASSGATHTRLTTDE